MSDKLTGNWYTPKGELIIKDGIALRRLKKGTLLWCKKCLTEATLDTTSFPMEKKQKSKK